MSSPSSPLSPATLNLLRTATPPLTALAAGLNLSLSIFVTPRLLESPVPIMLHQWLATYNLGARTVPFLCGLSALSYLSLARHFAAAGNSATGRGYFAAGTLCLGIVPYTFGVMGGTNGLLKEMEGKVNGVGVEGTEGDGGSGGKVEVSEEAEQGARYLVDHWGLLNLGRAVMIGGAAVVGVGLML